MHSDDPLRHTLAELTTRIHEEVARRIDRLSRDAVDAETRAGRRGRALLEAFTRIDACGTLTAVLDELMSSAREHAARVALFVVRAGRLERWRSEGFVGRPDLDGPLVLAAGTALLLERVMRSNEVACAPEDAPAADFAPRDEGCRAAAFPLALGGDVAAVFYAETDVLNAEKGPAGQAPAAEWAVALELLTRYAARRLESITALGVARLVADLAAWPTASTGTRSEHAGPPPAEEGEAEQGARRYARLLVSEIKLYHEDAIAAGRRERDLLTRLGGEIARARAMYDERVPPSVRQAADVFREELVRTLADGDATLILDDSETGHRNWE